MLLTDSPILIKEIITQDHIELTQHGDYYVVSFNGKSLSPTRNLTIALDFFDKLTSKYTNVN